MGVIVVRYASWLVYRERSTHLG